MLGLPRHRLKRIALFTLAAFFIGAGAYHFINADFYLAIMPPFLPFHLELVYVSGLFEILGGIGVLCRASRSLAGWGLIALLFAVYPVNIHMALNPELFIARGMPLWSLYLRLPLQFVLLAWAYWTTRPEPSK